jgi:ABC-type branched-subunit amino acid transport system substrate-binding protein
VTDSEIRTGGIYMYGMALAKLFIPPIYREMVAVAQVANDAGGIYGRKIKVIDCDDGAPDPARTRACYKKLVQQDKIFAFLGGATWVQGELQADDAKDGVPWIAPVSLYKSEWENPWAFPIHMGMEHEAHAGAQWVVNNIHPKTFGLVCLNTAEMQATCDAATAVLTAAGAKMVHRVNTDVDKPDLSGDILAMRAANPDHVLHYCAHPAVTARFLIDSAQQNYWPPKGVSGNHMAFEAVGGLIGDYPAKHGWWTNTTYKLWGADYVAWTKKYAPDNEGLSHHVLQGQWFGAQVGVEAMKQVGPNLTRAGLRKVLESRVWETSPGLAQKFMWEPSQRNHKGTGARDEYMYKYVSAETKAKNDGTGDAPGFVPSPEQFQITDSFD